MSDFKKCHNKEQRYNKFSLDSFGQQWSFSYLQTPCIKATVPQHLHLAFYANISPLTTFYIALFQSSVFSDCHCNRPSISALPLPLKYVCQDFCPY